MPHDFRSPVAQRWRSRNRATAARLDSHARDDEIIQFRFRSATRRRVKVVRSIPRRRVAEMSIERLGRFARLLDEALPLQERLAAGSPTH